MSKGEKVFVIVGLVMAALAVWAIWTLREPLEQTVDLVKNSVQPESSVSFAVIGDNHGVNAVYRKAIKEISGQPVDFLLNLADTSEFGTSQEFQDIRELEKILPFPVYHTVGNHDIKADPSRTLFAGAFGQQPNHSVDRGPLHLIILDNADRKVGFSQATLDWLADDLSRHQDKTIIIAYHRPFDLPLANVTGDDETTTSRASNDRFLDVIEPYTIRYILTGHIHTFLEYTVGNIPAVVSGGGGDPAQTVLGGAAANYFHYLVFSVQGREVTHELYRLQLSPG